MKACFHYKVGWKTYQACKDRVSDCWMGNAAHGDHVWLFQHKVVKIVFAFTKWSYME